MVPFYEAQRAAGLLALPYEEAVAAMSPRWAETEDEFVVRVRDLSVPADAVGVRIADESEVPTDRTFRDAWRSDGKKMSIDMPRARELHRERLRAARAPLLAALDVEAIRADEVGDAEAKSAIVARKQRLRDVTRLPEIEAATTAEALTKVWPL